MPKTARGSRRLSRSGYLLGFGLGGFFDAILLHQILQWHHLLSLVEGVGDIRNQVLFDGLFHALMYLIAAAGLVTLVRGRHELAREGAARLLVSNALIGFGTWHVLDSILSHWLLGIHRIRVDSSAPLMWDLIWFAAFGVGPVLLGLLLRRRGRILHSGQVAAALLVFAVLGGGVWAAQSPSDARSAIAVFQPGMSDGHILTAIRNSGGSVVWTSSGIWAVQWSDAGGGVSDLYRDGALLVSNSYLAAGCLAWTRI
ncbi:DUF2243 domain-containing protein [Novosphingobium sp. M1R2S20]|uniref:DUF2243 domain-containing protein n=1 Tax=Novosphingobium rhizovicinum TaxID=3228928 RepID=A0ABV3RC31_9SPHN